MTRLKRGQFINAVIKMFSAVRLNFYSVGVSCVLKTQLRKPDALLKIQKVADKLDVTSQIMSKVGVGFKHLGPKVGKFVARNANGSEILNSGFELVNGIYKNLKKKTPSHTVFLGYIDGQVQLVGEQVKKVKCKLWGKCRAGGSLALVADANFRADANLAAGCIVDDVAGEAFELLVKKFNKSSDWWKFVKSNPELKGAIQNFAPIEITQILFGKVCLQICENE